jgi:hypothetical protein
MIPVITPKNDCAFVVTLRLVDDTGRYVNLTTGTLSAFLAASESSTAEAADPSLVGSVVYTGAGGRWLVRFDASILTSALLASLFASDTPYIIVEGENNVRFAIEAAYSDSKLVEVTE